MTDNNVEMDDLLVRSKKKSIKVDKVNRIFIIYISIILTFIAIFAMGLFFGSMTVSSLVLENKDIIKRSLVNIEIITNDIVNKFNLTYTINEINEIVERINVISQSINMNQLMNDFNGIAVDLREIVNKLNLKK